MTIHRRAAALAVALGALALAGCVLMPEAPTPPAPCSALAVHPLPACSQVPTLSPTSVTYSQSQAVPGFDGGAYLVTDADALATLADVVRYEVQGDTTIVGDCDGGRTTHLVVETTQHGTVTIVVDTCTDEAFPNAIDELVSGWHASGVGTPVP